jgi:hypothetical protein
MRPPILIDFHEPDDSYLRWKPSRRREVAASALVREQVEHVAGA